MAGKLWHRSSTMPSNSTFSDLLSKGVFALLLVSVVLSGTPMIEVHAHENAAFGHSHDAHDFFESHGAEEAKSEVGNSDTTSLHAHDISATSLGVLASVSVESTVPQHFHHYIPPTYRWLPDNVIAPLYRPPIA